MATRAKTKKKTTTKKLTDKQHADKIKRAARALRMACLAAKKSGLVVTTQVQDVMGGFNKDALAWYCADHDKYANSEYALSRGKVPAPKCPLAVMRPVK